MHANISPDPDPPKPKLTAVEALLKIQPDLARRYTAMELQAHVESDLRLLAHVLMTQARVEAVPD